VEDPRADGGKRQIEILPDMVTVQRATAGVKMRFAVPITLFEGVALRIAARRPAGSVRATVRLVHDDPDLCIVLFEADDDRNVTAEWQYWAARFGLPMLVAHDDGAYTEPFPRLGALNIGRPRQRRRPADFARRRPRFLTRRRVARLPERPTVHREREIIARD
jgi:hypothetical protein